MGEEEVLIEGGQVEVEAEEVEEVVGTKCQFSYPATSAVNDDQVDLAVDDVKKMPKRRKTFRRSQKRGGDRKLGDGGDGGGSATKHMAEGWQDNQEHDNQIKARGEGGAHVQSMMRCDDETGTKNKQQPTITLNRPLRYYYHPIAGASSRF